MFAGLLLQAALALSARIPTVFLRRFASLIADVEYRWNVSRREAVLANLKQIGLTGHPRLKEARDRQREAHEVFRSYHSHLVEFLAQRRLAGAAWARAFRFEGMELLYAAAASGRGAVIAASHLGNWELAGLALTRFGFGVHVVTGTQWNPLFHGAVRSLKERSGIAVSTPQDGFMPLLASLRRGALVVLLVDGDVYTRGVPAAFFGRPVPFPAGPALLARRAGVPLLHAHTVRTDDGHRIVFSGADRADRTLPLRRDVERLTARVAAAQERNIAAHVGQWCIFRPFFIPADGDAGADAA